MTMARHPTPALPPADASLIALGAAIREMRHERDLSQARLAFATIDLGYSLTCAHLSKIERGQIDPRFLTLCLLASGLQIPLQRLIARAGTHLPSPPSSDPRGA
jgi:transcriptional regulator with XRE-family HTH domain